MYKAIECRNEVFRLNCLQVLNASHSIYFTQALSDKQRLEVLKQGKSNRPKHRYEVIHAILDEESSLDSHQRFRVVSVEELKSILEKSESVKTMVQSFTVPLVPSNWPRLFKYKLKPRFVDTKTGAGVLRPRFANHIR